MASGEAHITGALRVGFDRGILLAMRPDLRAELNQLGNSWVATAVVLATPLAYAAWLIEKNAVLSLAVAGAAGFLLFNLLRLIHSGGGGALHVRPARDYRPPLVSGLLLLGLALLLAQPAQLLLPSAAVESAVDAHRADIILQHQQSLSDLGAATDTRFEQRLADCEFILLRLRLVWQHPGQAVLGSVVYSLLALVPLFLQFGPYLDAVQAYERYRYRASHRRVSSRAQVANQVTLGALSRYESYDAPSAEGHFLNTHGGNR